MTKEQITETVLQIFAENTGAHVTQQSRLADLSIDSLDELEILMAIEDEFNISIPDEDVQGVNSIEDVINHIEQSLAN